MKILERMTLLVFAATLLLFIGNKTYRHFFVDNTPPVLTMAADTVDVSRNDDRSALLRGITAHDDTDGDLTGQIMVQGVTQLIGENTAKVTYVVFDSSNNMASCTRTVRYTDYERPHFAMKTAAVYAAGETVTLLDRLQAVDVVDGDISGNIRVVSQNLSAEPGVYSVTVQVANSLGDLESLTLKIVIRDDQQPIRLRLSDYIVYLQQGAEFVPADYIASPGAQQVDAEHQVDTSVPGVYQVCYTHGSDMVWQTVVVR